MEVIFITVTLAFFIGVFALIAKLDDSYTEKRVIRKKREKHKENLDRVKSIRENKKRILNIDHSKMKVIDSENEYKNEEKEYIGYDADKDDWWKT